MSLSDNAPIGCLVQVQGSEGVQAKINAVGGALASNHDILKTFRRFMGMQAEFDLDYSKQEAGQHHYHYYLLQRLPTLLSISYYPIHITSRSVIEPLSC
jgi:hypothetical protein